MLLRIAGALTAPTSSALRCRVEEVAVGTEISLRPPHRSRRALLTHRAPTLDGDEKPLFGPRAGCVGMASTGQRSSSFSSTLVDVFGFDASERRANVRSCDAGTLRSLSRSSAQHNRPSSRAEPG